MKITLKNLQQQTFEVEIDPSKTVQDLKEKIHSEKGSDYPADSQRLIYAGKILRDSVPISAYEIDEKKFIVVMVSKPKVPPIPHTSPRDRTAPTPAVDKNEATTNSETTPSARTENTNTQPQNTNTERNNIAAQAESALLTGTEYNTMVQNIIELGFERPQVEAALKASYSNPDRAVEYLMSGNIPPDPSLEDVGQPAAADQQGLSNEPLAFLRNQPQFQNMRNLVQRNPNFLNAVLQQIGQSNPDLLQLISQNQEEFVRMLNEPTTGSGTTPPMQLPTMPTSNTAGSGVTSPPTGTAAATGATGITPTQQQGNVTTISVTAQDKEAIERLKALGFPEHLVVQAYLVCDRNENMAANFLLSNNMDD